MKKLIQINLLLWYVSCAAAQEKTVRVYDWKDFKLQPGSAIVSMNGISVLKIENTNNAPVEVSLLKVTNPAVIEKADAFSCEMKYENVRHTLIERTNRDGFGPLQTSVSGKLAVLCRLPPPAPGGDESTNEGYFEISGTANWRLYQLNVDRTAAGGLPTQLELKLSMPANGTVYLRPVKLLGTVRNWWSPELAGLIGGIGGSVIGCFGGLLGCLAGMGKARRFVLGMTRIFIGLGILLTIAGLVAVALHQPYAVWYALLLPGGILTLVFGVNLYPIKRRYDDMEIRRMTSVDTMGN